MIEFVVAHSGIAFRERARARIVRLAFVAQSVSGRRCGLDWRSQR